MTSYRIQCRNSDTLQWETQHTVKPMYAYVTKRVRNYLFFRKIIGVVPNLVAAEKAAHKEAIRFAKKAYGRQPTRVERLSMWNSVEAKDVVWQNGRAVMSEKQTRGKK